MSCVNVTYSDNLRARRKNGDAKRVPDRWWRELAERYRVASVWCTYWEWLTYTDEDSKVTSTRHPPPDGEEDGKSRVDHRIHGGEGGVYRGGSAYRWMVTTNPRLVDLRVYFNAREMGEGLDLPVIPNTLRRLRLRLQGCWRWNSLSRLTSLVRIDASIGDLSDCRHLPPTLTSCRIRNGDGDTKDIVEAWRHIVRLPRLRHVSTTWCGSTPQVMDVFITAAPLAWERLSIHSGILVGKESTEVCDGGGGGVFPSLQRLRIYNAEHYSTRDWKRWKCFAPSLSSLEINLSEFSIFLERSSLLKKVLPIGEWSSLRRLVLSGEANLLLDAPPSAFPWQSLHSLEMRWRDPHTQWGHPARQLTLHFPFLVDITELTLTPRGGDTDIMFRSAAHHFTRLTRLTLHLYNRVVSSEILTEMRAFTRLVYFDITFAWECTEAELILLGTSLPGATLQCLRTVSDWYSIKNVSTWTTFVERLVSLTDWTLSYSPRCHPSPPVAHVALALERGCRVHWLPYST